MPVRDILELIIKSKHAGDGEKKAAKGISDVVKAATALGSALAVKEIAQYTVEMVKLGAASERQAGALDNLASAAGTSGDAIMSAIRGASDFTIDRMSAMAAANKAMVMDVAKSPQEFERLTKVAVSLGRAMGQDATKSIDDFVTASARQSQMIADNLGLTVTVGQATERYAAQLGVTVDELTDAQKKQAFLNMMLEEGEKKMATLGDQSLDTAGKIEQTATAWQDTKTAIAEAMAALADASGVLDRTASGMRTWTGQVEVFSNAMQELRDGASLKDALFDIEPQDVSVLDSAAQSYTAMARAQDEARGRTQEWSRASDELKTKLNSQVESQGSMMHSVLAAAEAIRREGIGSNEDMMRAVLESTDAVDRQAESFAVVARQAEGMGDYLFNASMSFTDFYERQEKTAQRFTQDREKLEQEHQEKLVELAEKGQGKAVQLNIGAEEEKLAALQRKLEIALQQESEFTDKAKESTKMRKEDQLNSLRGQISEQTAMLDNYHAGRLRTTGKNVSDLVAKENERYDQEMAMLEESRAAQEEEQRRSLGKMVLQHFTSWAQMQGLTAEETLKMQLDISQKYGLIETEAAQHVNNMSMNWAASVAQMRGDASSFFDAFTQRFNALPSEKIIRIRTELSTPGATEGATGGTTETGKTGEFSALGTGFAMGGTTLVGERGPELVNLPRGSQVFSAGQTRGMMRGGGAPAVQNFTFNISNPDPAVVVRQIERYMRIKNKSTGAVMGR